jgi:pimeloyl-ACP methyl ester carboxylesterase
MADFVDANGVHTYYEVHGSGDPLLLLHGGLSTADDFAMQTAPFAEHHRVILPERRAHGHTADVDGPITYDVMADDTIAFMETLGTGPAHLFGWSDGGNIALLVAIRRPDLVRKIATTGANFSTDGCYVDGFKASFTPDSEFVTAMRNEWAERTPDDPDHFAVVLEKITKLWFGTWSIPAADLAGIEAPVLVMSGDDDAVRLAHTLALYEAVPNAQLAVIPGTSHLAPVEKPELVNSLVVDFLASGPPQELFPFRRQDPPAGVGN